MSSPRRRFQLLEPAAAALLALASLAVLAWHIRFLAVPMVDDAATSISYALTLVKGGGLRLTPYSQAVEAFSNPLWVFLSAGGAGLHLDPVVFTQRLGQLLGCLALAAFFLWGPLSQGRAPRVEDGWVGLAALIPGYAYWSASGMETGLEVLLLGVCGALLLWELRRGRGSWTGLGLALLCLTRPEGALFAVLAGVLWIALRASQRQRPGLQEAQITAWVAALVGAYLVCRRLYFASWLPNTFYAKLHWDFSLAAYLDGYWQAHTLLIVCGTAGAALGLAFQPSRRATALALTFVASVLIFNWHAHGDWMREWRFLAPLPPLLATCAAQGVHGLRRGLAAGLARLNRPWPWAPPALLVVLLGAVAILIAQSAQERSSALKRSPEFPITFTVPAHQAAKRALDTFGALRPVVALADIGGAGLVWRSAEVIDAAGLGDYALARAPNHATMEDYLLAQLPALIDAHGPSGHLRDMPKLMAYYEPAGRQFPWLAGWNGLLLFKGLSADQDPRCPASRSNVATMPLGALEEGLTSLEAGQPIQALRLWRCAQSYRAEPLLPPPGWRATLAGRSGETAASFARRGRWREAVDHYDLACALSGGSAHYRAAAEALRAKLFSSPPSSSTAGVIRG